MRNREPGCPRPRSTSYGSIAVLFGCPSAPAPTNNPFCEQTTRGAAPGSTDIICCGREVAELGRPAIAPTTPQLHLKYPPTTPQLPPNYTLTTQRHPPKPHQPCTTTPQLHHHYTTTTPQQPKDTHQNYISHAPGAASAGHGVETVVLWSIPFPCVVSSGCA